MVSLGAQAQRVTIEKDIVYASRDGLDLMLDVGKVEEQQGRLPAIIYLPGNSWGAAWGFAWDRSQGLIPIMQTAREGYVVISIDYSPISIKEGGKTKFPFPTQIYDVKNAIRWVRAHADQYGIDPEKIGLLGWSSGGHLALLAALTGPKDNLDGDVKYAENTCDVQAVVTIGAPTDMAANYADYPDDRDVLQALLMGTPTDRQEAYHVASPITYVHKGSPPILSIMGTDDAPGQAEILDARMKEVGANHTLLLIEGMEHHNDWVDPSVIPFFNKYLKAVNK
jgi:acetyl esterase/lipase